jgi:hypothetical protein
MYELRRSVVTSFSRADIAWIPFVEICARAGIDIDAATCPDSTLGEIG